jgi:hypothetical protein
MPRSSPASPVPEAPRQPIRRDPRSLHMTRQGHPFRAAAPGIGGVGGQADGATTDWLVPRAMPLAGPGQSPGLTSFSPGVPWAGNGHEVYRDDNRQKTMTLPAEEFIRRFLIHVLPDGFHRIRYFGFLANCHRARKLALCRKLLGMTPAGPATDPPADYRDRLEALTGQSLRECPHCHTGIMVVIDCIAAPKICQPVPDT